MSQFPLFSVPLVTLSLLLCSAMNASKSLSQPAAIDLVNTIDQNDSDNEVQLMMIHPPSNQM